MNVRSFVIGLGFAVGSMSPISIADEPGLAAQEQAKPLPSYCPPPGTSVSLAKAVSDAFVNDYKDCDIAVDATFYKMGNAGYRLRYDTKANVTFQVLEPGGSPRSQLGRSFGIFAGIAKAQSALLFELKEGDAVVLRGAPVRQSVLGTSLGGLFHASSVAKK